MLNNWPVIDGWKNSRVSPHTRDVLQRRIARKQYEEHPKHIFPMTQIELFNNFKEEHKEVKFSINKFVQQKPWFVRPIIVHDTCFCHYHAEFELYYETFFFILVNIYGQFHFLLLHSVFLYMKFYVREGDDLF
jgi:hypothetical protein